MFKRSYYVPRDPKASVPQEDDQVPRKFKDPIPPPPTRKTMGVNSALHSNLMAASNHPGVNPQVVRSITHSSSPAVMPTMATTLPMRGLPPPQLIPSGTMLQIPQGRMGPTSAIRQTTIFRDTQTVGAGCCPFPICGSIFGSCFPCCIPQQQFLHQTTQILQPNALPPVPVPPISPGLSPISQIQPGAPMPPGNPPGLPLPRSMNSGISSGGGFNPNFGGGAPPPPGMPNQMMSTLNRPGAAQQSSNTPSSLRDPSKISSQTSQRGGATQGFQPPPPPPGLGFQQQSSQGFKPLVPPNIGFQPPPPPPRGFQAPFLSNPTGSNTPQYANQSSNISNGSSGGKREPSLAQGLTSQPQIASSQNQMNTSIKMTESFMPYTSQRKNQNDAELVGNPSGLRSSKGYADGNQNNQNPPDGSQQMEVLKTYLRPVPQIRHAAYASCQCASCKAIFQRV